MFLPWNHSPVYVGSWVEAAGLLPFSDTHDMEEVVPRRCTRLECRDTVTRSYGCTNPGWVEVRPVTAGGPGRLHHGREFFEGPLHPTGTHFSFCPTPLSRTGRCRFGESIQSHRRQCFVPCHDLPSVFLQGRGDVNVVLRTFYTRCVTRGSVHGPPLSGRSIHDPFRSFPTSFLPLFWFRPSSGNKDSPSLYPFITSV